MTCEKCGQELDDFEASLGHVTDTAARVKKMSRIPVVCSYCRLGLNRPKALGAKPVVVKPPVKIDESNATEEQHQRAEAEAYEMPNPAAMARKQRFRDHAQRMFNSANTTWLRGGRELIRKHVNELYVGVVSAESLVDSIGAAYIDGTASEAELVRAVEDCEAAYSKACTAMNHLCYACGTMTAVVYLDTKYARLCSACYRDGDERRV